MAHLKEIAIAGIILIEAIALWKEMDGATLSLVIAAIAGIAGYELRICKEKKE